MMVLKPEIDPNLCRLCGKSDGLKVDIFDEKHNYQKKIHSLLPIAIFEYDPLPKKMCHRCMFQVDGYHEFRENCLKTEAYLKLQLPWMPRKSTRPNVNSEVPSMGTQPMVHISSPTLNAFTMGQWFASRKTMEADNEVEIVDVYCQRSSQNDTPHPKSAEELTPSSDVVSSKQKSEPEVGVAHGKNLLGENKNTEDHKGPHKTRMKKKKQNNRDKQQQAQVEQQVVGHTNEKTKIISSTCEKSSTSKVQASSQTSPDVEVIDITDNDIDDQLQQKQEQSSHIKGTGLKIKLVKEANQLLAVLGDQTQHKVKEQELVQNRAKLNSPSPEMPQNHHKDYEGDGTKITLSLRAVSGSVNTSGLTPKGIAHVRKQMERQQKKNLQSSASASGITAAKGGCPSGCRRRNFGGKQAGISTSSPRKLTRANQKPDEPGSVSKTDEGGRRVLAPKNALKVSVTKNLVSGGISGVSDNVSRFSQGSQENLNSGDKTISRETEEISKSHNFSNIVVQNETKEDRPGIIVTRIPSACDIYTCEACERMFVTRETAYGHICDEGKDSNCSETRAIDESWCTVVTQHGVSDLYTCCVCGQRFSRNVTLAAHLKSHEEMWSNSESGDDCCSLKDIDTDSNDSAEHTKGSRRRRRGSRKAVCPRKSVKLSLPVSV